MAYCALNDITKMIPEAALIQLTDDTGTGVVGQDAINEAIAQADAEINAYCGKVYSVPFTTIPDVIRKTSVDLAIYNLYSRRAEEIPQTRADRYRNAVRLLENIARGTISIGVDPEPAEKSEGASESNKPLCDRIFTRERMKDF